MESPRGSLGGFRSPRSPKSPYASRPASRSEGRAHSSPRPLSPVRDFAASGLSSSVFSKQGQSYAEQYSHAIGSPGQNCYRLDEGPSCYINGPPNKANKASLEKTVLDSPRGLFSCAKRVTLDSVPSPCRRTAVGPDPYFVEDSRQAPSPRMARFASDRSNRLPFALGRTANAAFDPCERARPHPFSAPPQRRRSPSCAPSLRWQTV
jgi:hypothetical protein